jgi:class 3 adenylate cyclase/tetratricopeptide (TPR) repeat protein
MNTGGVGAAPSPNDVTDVLLPYMPRLVADWAQMTPDERWRPIRGTMVFADLSGFTAMSERLARLGRQGAEEVTDAIATCFSALLAVAYDAGGGLLKFGGDALLLAFTGPEHGPRAVWAAAAMRERLRKVGLLSTPAGNVRLRMSVGVHSGTFDCFLVGTPSRELIVTGPAASEVVAMEHDASAGQIVVSGATAASLSEVCIGEAIGPGFRLRRSPERPASYVEDFGFQYDIDLRELVPSAVHEHLLAGGGAPEHRVVTVAFVHFDDIDARLARDGPETTARDLEELVTTVAASCASHDVALLASDVDADGGKFVLTAGAPSQRGHDEERMLAAVRRIVDADLAIPVRVGVNRGPVFAGDVGPHYRRTYTVMGDTVNLAARLMAAADSRQVFATADVLDRAPGFASNPLPPMNVKGKRAPVQAFDVGPALDPADRAAGGAAAIDLPFVGRESELAQLVGFTERARLGRGEAVALIGQAGVGKTRLLAEFVATVSDVPTVRIVCEAYEIATPYAAMKRMLRAALDLGDDPIARVRDLIETNAPELLPWLPLLGTVLGIDLPDSPESAALAPQFRAARTAASVASLLAMALPAPVLIVIEDMEWIDDASRDIVDVFAALVEDSGIVLVSVGWDDDSVAQHTAAVEVLPLARDDVETALRRATERKPLRPHELAALAERADGNPLFLTELWRAASVGGFAGDDLPDSVETLVTAQLDRLSPSLRTLLGFAAVLGRSFDRGELRELAGSDLVVSDNAWPAVAEFVQLESGDRVRFRHGLLRDAAYARLPFRRRRELHERAARAIEQRLRDRRDTAAELLSLHFFQAQVFEEAWRYARVAGDRARARYANVEAAALFERALAAARRLPDLDPTEIASAREALGDAHDRIGEYERALLDFRAARRLVRGDPVREAELLLKEAWIPERIGKYRDAVRTIRKGLVLVADASDRAAVGARAQLSAWYAVIRQGQGRHREAIEWCERAIEDAIAAGDRDAEAHARYVLDWAYTELGELDWVTNLPRALELYADLGDLSGQGLVLNLQGACAYWRGDWDGAVALYEQAEDAYDRAGSAVDAARAVANIAEVLSDQGRFDDADTHLRDALAVSAAAGYHYDIALITGFLGRNCVRAGRLDEGFEFLNASRAEYDDAGLPGDVLRIDAWRAEALMRADDAEGALALAESTLHAGRIEGGTSPEDPLLERVRAEALAHGGDIHAARSAIEASIEAARIRDAEFELAMTLDVAVQLNLAPHQTAEMVAERDDLFARFNVVRRDG